jgi:transcriptional regulator with XRE-family HTH domain
MSGLLDTSKIAAAREKAGLSQAAAAEAAGITRQRWNDIEKGRKPNIELDTLQRVAEALGVKAKDLLK